MKTLNTIFNKVNTLSEIKLFGALSVFSFLILLFTILVPYYTLRFEYGAGELQIKLMTVLLKNHGVWTSFAMFASFALITFYYWYVVGGEIDTDKRQNKEEEETGDIIPEVTNTSIMTKEDISKLMELEKALEV